jgi:hypothetical protein
LDRNFTLDSSHLKAHPQEKIKNGTVLVKTKVEEYLTKKRQANLATARLKLKSVLGSSLQQASFPF